MIDRMEEIRKRHEGTTPGPWMVNSGGHHPMREVGAPFADSGSQSIALCRAISIDDNGGGERDAEFIAMAKEDIPYLLSRVEELEKELIDSKSHFRNSMLEASVWAFKRRTWDLEMKLKHLWEENQRLRSQLEKKDQHLAEVRRGAEF